VVVRKSEYVDAFIGPYVPGGYTKMRADRVSLDNIREAQEAEKIRLTQSEEEFLESVEERLDSEKDLTRKMREWLGRIQERISVW
jgi:hypothetical protein